MALLHPPQPPSTWKGTLGAFHSPELPYLGKNKPSLCSWKEPQGSHIKGDAGLSWGREANDDLWDACLVSSFMPTYKYVILPTLQINLRGM